MSSINDVTALGGYQGFCDDSTMVFVIKCVTKGGESKIVKKVLKKEKFDYFQASVSEKSIYPVKDLAQMADKKLKRPVSPPPPVPNRPKVDVFRPSAPPPPPDLIQNGKGSSIKTKFMT